MIEQPSGRFIHAYQCPSINRQAQKSVINWTIPARKYDILQNVYGTSLIGQEHSEDESDDSERHDLKFLNKYIKASTSDCSLSHLIIYNRYSEGDYQIMLPYQNISFARIDTDCVF